MQTLREEGLPFCKGLTIPQKICYTALGLVYFEGWSRLILYFTPAIVLLTGIAPIGDTRLFFHYFIPYFLFSWLCIEEFGRGNTRFFISEYMAMARFPVSFLSTLGLLYKRKRFRITSKEKSRKTPVYLILPQILILVFNISAFAVGITFPPKELILTMSGGTILVICFWAAVNVLLSFSVIIAVVRDEQNKSHRFRFQIPLPIKLTMNNSMSFYSVISEISDKTVAINVNIDQPPQPGSIIDCKIYLPEHSISVKAEVDSVTKDNNSSGILMDNLLCNFLWSNTSDYDLLNKNLHACSWHRKFCWDGGFFMMPLEWLSNPKRHFLAKKRYVNNRWKSVLYKVNIKDDCKYHFGLIKHSNSNVNILRFCPFNKINGRQEISIISFDSEGTSEFIAKTNENISSQFRQSLSANYIAEETTSCTYQNEMYIEITA